MNVDRVTAIPLSRASVLPQALPAGSATTNFGDLLKEILNRVSDSHETAQAEARKLLTGEATDIHSVTIALAEAQTSLQLAVQVRDRLVEAYREIRQMPL